VNSSPGVAVSGDRPAEQATHLVPKEGLDLPGIIHRQGLLGD
jgi:hypothetical protein